MKNTLVLTFACLVACTLTAESPAVGLLDRARDKLEEGQRVFFAENDRDTALSLYTEAEGEISRASDSSDRETLLVEIWLARGELYEIAGQKKAADQSFSKAHEIAESLYRARPDDSHVCRVSADALMRLLPYRLLPFKARYGFEPRDRALGALKINPNNREARLSLGLYFYFCPTLFGGSTDKARLYFEEYASVVTDDTARFKAAMWLAMANGQLGHVDEAERAFADANAIYPKSDWLRSERAKFDKKSGGKNEV